MQSFLSRGVCPRRSPPPFDSSDAGNVPDCAEALASLLRSNTTLRVLDLPGIAVRSDTEAALVGSALALNSTLQHVVLSGLRRGSRNSATGSHRFPAIDFLAVQLKRASAAFPVIGYSHRISSPICGSQPLPCLPAGLRRLGRIPRSHVLFFHQGLCSRWDNSRYDRKAHRAQAPVVFQGSDE